MAETGTLKGAEKGSSFISSSNAMQSFFHFLGLRFGGEDFEAPEVLEARRFLSLALLLEGIAKGSSSSQPSDSLSSLLLEDESDDQAKFSVSWWYTRETSSLDFVVSPIISAQSFERILAFLTISDLGLLKLEAFW